MPSTSTGSVTASLTAQILNDDEKEELRLLLDYSNYLTTRGMLIKQYTTGFNTNEALLASILNRKQAIEAKIPKPTTPLLNYINHRHHYWLVLPDAEKEKTDAFFEEKSKAVKAKKIKDPIEAFADSGIFSSEDVISLKPANNTEAAIKAYAIELLNNIKATHFKKAFDKLYDEFLNELLKKEKEAALTGLQAKKREDLARLNNADPNYLAQKKGIDDQYKQHKAALDERIKQEKTNRSNHELSQSLFAVSWFNRSLAWKHARTAESFHEQMANHQVSQFKKVHPYHPLVADSYQVRHDRSRCKKELLSYPEFCQKQGLSQNWKNSDALKDYAKYLGKEMADMAMITLFTLSCDHLDGERKIAIGFNPDDMASFLKFILKNKIISELLATTFKENLTKKLEELQSKLPPGDPGEVHLKNLIDYIRTHEFIDEIKKIDTANSSVIFLNKTLPKAEHDALIAAARTAEIEKLYPEPPRHLATTLAKHKNKKISIAATKINDIEKEYKKLVTVTQTAEDQFNAIRNSAHPSEADKLAATSAMYTHVQDALKEAKTLSTAIKNALIQCNSLIYPAPAASQATLVAEQRELEAKYKKALERCEIIHTAAEALFNETIAVVVNEEALPAWRNCNRLARIIGSSATTINRRSDKETILNDAKTNLTSLERDSAAFSKAADTLAAIPADKVPAHLTDDLTDISRFAHANKERIINSAKAHINGMKLVVIAQHAADAEAAATAATDAEITALTVFAGWMDRSSRSSATNPNVLFDTIEEYLTAVNNITKRWNNSIKAAYTSVKEQADTIDEADAYINTPGNRPDLSDLRPAQANTLTTADTQLQQAKARRTNVLIPIIARVETAYSSITKVTIDEIKKHAALAHQQANELKDDLDNNKTVASTAFDRNKSQVEAVLKCLTDPRVRHIIGTDISGQETFSANLKGALDQLATVMRDNERNPYSLDALASYRNALIQVKHALATEMNNNRSNHNLHAILLAYSEAFDSANNAFEKLVVIHPAFEILKKAEEVTEAISHLQRNLFPLTQQLSDIKSSTPSARHIDRLKQIKDAYQNSEGERDCIFAAKALCLNRYDTAPAANAQLAKAFNTIKNCQSNIQRFEKAWNDTILSFLKKEKTDTSAFLTEAQKLAPETRQDIIEGKISKTKRDLQWLNVYREIIGTEDEILPEQITSENCSSVCDYLAQMISDSSTPPNLVEILTLYKDTLADIAKRFSTLSALQRASAEIEEEEEAVEEKDLTVPDDKLAIILKKVAEATETMKVFQSDDCDLSAANDGLNALNALNLTKSFDYFKGFKQIKGTYEGYQDQKNLILSAFDYVNDPKNRPADIPPDSRLTEATATITSYQMTIGKFEEALNHALFNFFKMTKEGTANLLSEVQSAPDLNLSSNATRWLTWLNELREVIGSDILPEEISRQNLFKIAQNLNHKIREEGIDSKLQRILILYSGALRDVGNSFNLLNTPRPALSFDDNPTPPPPVPPNPATPPVPDPGRAGRKKLKEKTHAQIENEKKLDLLVTAAARLSLIDCIATETVRIKILGTALGTAGSAILPAEYQNKVTAALDSNKPDIDQRRGSNVKGKMELYQDILNFFPQYESLLTSEQRDQFRAQMNALINNEKKLVVADQIATIEAKLKLLEQVDSVSTLSLRNGLTEIGTNLASDYINSVASKKTTLTRDEHNESARLLELKADVEGIDTSVLQKKDQEYLIYVSSRLQTRIDEKSLQPIVDGPFAELEAAIEAAADGLPHSIYRIISKVKPNTIDSLFTGRRVIASAPPDIITCQFFDELMAKATTIQSELNSKKLTDKDYVGFRNTLIDRLTKLEANLNMFKSFYSIKEDLGRLVVGAENTNADLAALEKNKQDARLLLGRLSQLITKEQPRNLHVAVGALEPLKIPLEDKIKAHITLLNHKIHDATAAAAVALKGTAKPGTVIVGQEADLEGEFLKADGDTGYLEPRNLEKLLGNDSYLSFPKKGEAAASPVTPSPADLTLSLDDKRSILADQILTIQAKLKLLEQVDSVSTLSLRTELSSIGVKLSGSENNYYKLLPEKLALADTDFKGNIKSAQKHYEELKADVERIDTSVLNNTEEINYLTIELPRRLQARIIEIASLPPIVEEKSAPDAVQASGQPVAGEDDLDFVGPEGEKQSENLHGGTFIELKQDSQIQSPEEAESDLLRSALEVLMIGNHLLTQSLIDRFVAIGKELTTLENEAKNPDANLATLKEAAELLLTENDITLFTPNSTTNGPREAKAKQTLSGMISIYTRRKNALINLIEELEERIEAQTELDFHDPRANPAPATHGSTEIYQVGEHDVEEVKEKDITEEDLEGFYSAEEEEEEDDFFLARQAGQVIGIGGNDLELIYEVGAALELSPDEIKHPLTTGDLAIHINALLKALRSEEYTKNIREGLVGALDDRDDSFAKLLRATQKHLAKFGDLIVRKDVKLGRRNSNAIDHPHIVLDQDKTEQLYEQLDLLVKQLMDNLKDPPSEESRQATIAQLTALHKTLTDADERDETLTATDEISEAKDMQKSCLDAISAQVSETLDYLLGLSTISEKPTTTFPPPPPYISKPASPTPVNDNGAKNSA